MASLLSTHTYTLYDSGRTEGGRKEWGRGRERRGKKEEKIRRKEGGGEKDKSGLI